MKKFYLIRSISFLIVLFIVALSAPACNNPRETNAVAQQEDVETAVLDSVDDSAAKLEEEPREEPVEEATEEETEDDGNTMTHRMEPSRSQIPNIRIS